MTHELVIFRELYEERGELQFDVRIRLRRLFDQVGERGGFKLTFR
jgi:hypothetical protein